MDGSRVLVQTTLLRWCAREDNSDGRVAGAVGEAALVAAVRDAHVALLAPRLTPAVADDPVVLAALGPIAHNGHTVVELVAVAEHGVVDAAMVQLPALPD